MIEPDRTVPLAAALLTVGFLVGGCNEAGRRPAVDGGADSAAPAAARDSPRPTAESLPPDSRPPARVPRDSLPEGAEAVSLLGEPLRPPPIPEEARARMEAQLAEARAAHEAAPDDADSIIWHGRRLAYLGRYRDAIDVYTEGISRHPDDARLYRHRGHRWITVRELDRAIADLERAAALVEGEPDRVEPDGMPNPAGIPRSTLQSNIWYHLALARYLRGDLEGSLPAWRACMEVSENDDMLVATSDWLYMTLRRLGRDAEAARVLEPIHPDMEILENDAYHRRLLMYRGEIPPDSLLGADEDDPVQVATYGYGVGNWHLYNGRPERAREIFRRILEGPSWAAFGRIAAEADLSRWEDVAVRHERPQPGTGAGSR